MYINNQKSSIYLLGHGIWPQLFISNNDPVQLWPPYCGGIQALDLTLEPLPQVTLHGDQLPQADKTPSTFNNKNEIYLSIYLSSILTKKNCQINLINFWSKDSLHCFMRTHCSKFVKVNTKSIVTKD